ncbi:MAG TPA: hypothetical protein VHY35_17810 [Stellaceae bacterium]|nr:hypothetical protein [Stellaceae bacterium]
MSACKQKDLTDDQKQILMYLETQPDGATAVWVAEGCKHFYDPQWARRRLQRLIDLGFVSKMAIGWYSITDAGRSALAGESGRL